MIDKNAVLESRAVPLEVVETPEWNGSVYVPVLSLSDLDELAKVQKLPGNTNALMAVRIIRDDQGSRIFTDDEATVLAGKPGAGKVILRILKRFNEVNGLTDDSAESAAKN